MTKSSAKHKNVEKKTYAMSAVSGVSACSFANNSSVHLSKLLSSTYRSLSYKYTFIGTPRTTAKAVKFLVPQNTEIAKKKEKKTTNEIPASVNYSKIIFCMVYFTA